MAPQVVAVALAAPPGPPGGEAAARGNVSRLYTPAEWLLLLGAATTVIATVLPWYSVSAEFGSLYSATIGAYAWTYWSGIVSGVAAIAAFALFGVSQFLPPTRPPYLKFAGTLYTALGAGALAGAVVYLVHVAHGVMVAVPGVTAGPAYGLYAAIGASAVLALGGVLHLARSTP